MDKTIRHHLFGVEYQCAAASEVHSRVLSDEEVCGSTRAFFWSDMQRGTLSLGPIAVQYGAARGLAATGSFTRSALSTVVPIRLGTPPLCPQSGAQRGAAEKRQNPFE